MAFLPTAARSRLRHLIEELEGEPGLHSVLAEFYERMQRDVMIGFFFEGQDVARIRTHQAELILKAAGLREEYTGKLPGQAHGQLPRILPGHFDRRIQILRETLQDWRSSSGVMLNPAAQQTWIDFEEAFRAVIL